MNNRPYYQSYTSITNPSAISSYYIMWGSWAYEFRPPVPSFLICPTSSIANLFQQEASAMADNKKVITVFVRIFVAPESIPVFVQALKSCVNHCLEEPECERLEVFQSAEGEFYLLETWSESKEWFIKVRQHAVHPMRCKRFVPNYPCHRSNLQNRTTYHIWL